MKAKNIVTANLSENGFSSLCAPVPMVHPAPLPPHLMAHPVPPPPPFREMLLKVNVDDADWERLAAVFGDQDTAYAAVTYIMKLHPEHQILFFQLLKLLFDEHDIPINLCFDSATDGIPDMSDIRWRNPFLGEQCLQTYQSQYNEDGQQIVQKLERHPWEWAIFSRIVTFLQSEKNKEE